MAESFNGGGDCRAAWQLAPCTASRGYGAVGQTTHVNPGVQCVSHLHKPCPSPGLVLLFTSLGKSRAKLEPPDAWRSLRREYQCAQQHTEFFILSNRSCCCARQTPEKDEYSRTRQQMSAHIDVCMGGRVAEELIFGADQVR